MPATLKPVKTAHTERTRIPRPGVAWGTYPERPDADDGPFANALRWAGRQARLLRPLDDRSLARFADRVIAAGDPLQALSDGELALQVRHLRASAGRDGLTDTTMLNGFALVREVSRRRMGMAHFPSQIIAARVLLQNRLAEMQTGEGKTLTAGLGAATAALTGIPVHAITANDYLVKRDAETMRPLYEGLGLSVGYVIQEMEEDERRVAYGCDITYCTAKELAFDYLRDRMVLGQRRGELHMRLDRLDGKDGAGQLRLRGLCMALIDEADSILLDEATTPLILSRANDDDTRTAVFRQGLAIASQLHGGIDYRLYGSERRATLTDAGRAHVVSLGNPLGSFWRSARRGAEIVEAALGALHLYRKDRDYVVQDDAVHIVDEHTGRIAPGRAWSRGIHQLVEMKEGVKITAENDPIAQITFQRFFPRYLRLCGMSGTLMEARAELLHTYGLEITRVPLHRPSQRTLLPVRGFAHAQEKWLAVVESARQCHDAGRPVIVGTDSVADSEHLGEMLGEVGLPCSVLNARQDRKEASIVAIAGMRGQITVTTNMAGRGTDIRLGPGVSEAGGLHVIACQSNSSRRTDRQLYGRCARQGEPGSVEALVSLEDPAVLRLIKGDARLWLARLLGPEETMPGWLARFLLAYPRWRADRRQRAARRRLARQDKQHSRLLAMGGPGE